MGKIWIAFVDRTETKETNMESLSVYEYNLFNKF